MQNNKLQTFYNTLIEYNNKFNLTTIVEKDEVEVKHFRDSLLGVDILNQIFELRKDKAKKFSILDIGAGAGFPSVPIAIKFCEDNYKKENISFTLIETVGKKVLFLEHIKNLLNLENINIKKSRIEDLEKATKYDVCISRAVASLPTLLEYALPFVKIGGYVVCYKANNYLEELNSSENALKILGGKLEKIEKYALPFKEETLQRNLIIVKKISETPAKYPRGGNKPRLKKL